MEEFDAESKDAEANGSVVAGGSSLYDRRYRRYKEEKVTGPKAHEWVVHPKDLEDVDEEDLKAINKGKASSTNEWFSEGKGHAVNDRSVEGANDKHLVKEAMETGREKVQNPCAG